MPRDHKLSKEEISVALFKMLKRDSIIEIVRTHELLRLARKTGAFKTAETLEWLIEHRDRTRTWGNAIHTSCPPSSVVP